MDIWEDRLEYEKYDPIIVNSLLNSLVNPAAKTCPPAIHLPPKVTTLTSLIFNTLSKIFGENFHLPFWGFTYMESYKVLVDINTTKSRDKDLL